MQKIQKQRRKAALEKAAFDRSGRRPDESLAAYKKRKQVNDEAIRAVRGYQLYTRKTKPTFEEWAKKLKAEFGSEAKDDHLQKLWTEITEKRKQRNEDVFRRLAESRGQEYKPPSPPRSEVPDTPAPPESTAPTPEPWVRSPLPPWARPLAPKPDKSSNAVQGGGGIAAVMEGKNTMQEKLPIASRLVLIVGALAIIAMTLFPPWRYLSGLPAGYAFIARPPGVYHGPIFAPVARIDTSRLGIQLVAVVFAAGLLAFACQSFSSKRTNGS